MSLSRKVHFPCPKCNTTMDVTVWDSVNTGLMQDLPKRIISGEFFDHVCPTCGFVGTWNILCPIMTWKKIS